MATLTVYKNITYIVEVINLTVHVFLSKRFTSKPSKCQSMLLPLSNIVKYNISPCINGIILNPEPHVQIH